MSNKMEKMRKLAITKTIDQAKHEIEELKKKFKKIDTKSLEEKIKKMYEENLKNLMGKNDQK